MLVRGSIDDRFNTGIVYGPSKFLQVSHLCLGLLHLAHKGKLERVVSFSFQFSVSCDPSNLHTELGMFHTFHH